MAKADNGFQILEQSPSEFAGTLALALILLFSCLFIFLFLTFMVFESFLK